MKNDAGQSEPLADGLITWEPIDGTPGQKASTRIQDGIYEFTSKDRLSLGTYRIEVMVMPPAIAAALEGESPVGPPQKFREIDSRFNANSILTYRITTETEHTFDALVTYRKN